MKTKLFVLVGMALVLIGATVQVHADSTPTPVPSTPTQTSGLVIPPPPANGWFVEDQLNWFSKAQVDQANAVAKGLKDTGIAEIGVLTINDCGSDHQTFRNSVFRSWGIGDKVKNNGLLIMVCWQDGGSTRTVEQETGYGLEGTIPDLLTANVFQSNFVPAFKGKDASQVISSGKAADAIIAMMTTYDNLLRNPTNAAGTATAVAPAPAPQGNGNWIWFLPNWLTLVIAIVIIIMIVAVIWASNSDGSSYGGGSSWGGGSSGGGFGGFGGGSSGGGSSGGGGFSGGSSGGGGSSGSF